MSRPRHRPGNLPAEITTFVGRRRELAEVRQKITSARLVSLIGPGGVGKTRLAFRMGADLARGFTDGVWLVELGDVSDAGLVPQAILAALDLRDQTAAAPLDILVSYLRERRLLLLIDNCEHLIEAAAQLVNDILRAAPEVRVIATSREPLQVPGEYVVPVVPLELPPEGSAEPLALIQQNDVVVLFVERAAAASGAFDLTATNRASVVALCRRLDGLPLAIELAAVRTRVLSVEQILERLDDRFALLTGGGRAALPRHQTLRTTIDWSFDLLTGAEQVLLRRLCVFAARFTLNDVEGVCAVGDADATVTLDLLGSIVEKSLVTAEFAAVTQCYRLHETMREYAALKLREAGEEDLVAERCLEHYRTTALRRGEDARYRLVDWLAWAGREIDNIRAVLHRCVDRGDLARGLDIATSLRYYWITRGTSEALRWLDQLLPSDDASPPTLARACYLRAWLTMLQGDPVAARPWAARAIDTARTAGLPAILSKSLSLAATIENVAGDHGAARLCLDEAETITRGLDDFPATIELLLSRAIHAIFGGDLDRASAASVEGLRLCREAGDLYLQETILRNLAMVEMLSGNNDSAHTRVVEALHVARSIDNRLAQFYALASVGWYAANAGRHTVAAQLLGAARSLSAQTGADMMGPLVPRLAAAKDLAMESLGAGTFDAEYAVGTSLSREAAVRLALGEAADRDAVTTTDNGPGPLAKREIEVARLVAEGLSNKQIAVRLFISDRTVASHVSSIMNKLGFNTRAQIAVWMTASA